MNTPRKLKPCIECQSPSYIFAHGRCRYCAQLHAVTEKKEKQVTLAQTEDGLEAKPFKYQTTVIKRKAIKPKDDYKGFFESLTIPERCEECNQVLLAFNNFGRRCVSAHILPKATFKSVGDEPQNILFLGAGLLGGCRCHDEWDSCIENRIKMRVYKKAVDTVFSFRHLLTDHEIIKARKYLGIDK